MPPNEIKPATTGKAGDSTLPEVITGQQVYENPQVAVVLDAKYARQLLKGSTTPSVYQNDFLYAINTGAVTVTDFDKGSPFQVINILGDGFTTVQNGPNIFTNTGANKLLLVNKVYTFTRFETVPGNKTWKWYEGA